MKLSVLERSLARRILGPCQAAFNKRKVSSAGSSSCGKVSNTEGFCSEVQLKIKNQIIEQDLKLKELEGDVNQWKVRMEKEFELYKQSQYTQETKVEGALNELRFSFVKGILAAVGLTVGVGSLIVNATRMLISTRSIYSGDCELSVASRESDANPAMDDGKAGSHSPANASKGKASSKNDAQSPGPSH